MISAGTKLKVPMQSKYRIKASQFKMRLSSLLTAAILFTATALPTAALIPIKEGAEPNHAKIQISWDANLTHHAVGDMRSDNSLKRLPRSDLSHRNATRADAHAPDMRLAIVDGLSPGNAGPEQSSGMTTSTSMVKKPGDMSVVQVAELIPSDSQPALPSSSNSKCAGLKSLSLPFTEITSSTEVQANTFLDPSSKASPAAIHPAFCRVQGILKPTSDSHIRFEVWMPSTDWNGRFEQIGNGGFAGLIRYGFMLPELRRGFAIAATDDGHVEVKGNEIWAINHPEKVIDYGYRAVHETSTHAKEIIDAYYGQTPSYSYFDGCSDGGREALMEAQRFPGDFNGIIAGAPANSVTHLAAAIVWDEQALTNNPASYIPASKLPAIQAAALKDCDTLDGVTDGLVEDPTSCHFDPSVLLCKSGDNSECLTGAQVETAKKLYHGPQDPHTGKQIFPGHEPGAEAFVTDWPEVLIGNAPGEGWEFPVGNYFFADFVFAAPSWNFRSLNFDGDIALADQKFASILNSTNADLRAFKNRGGKLIQYHGWADTVIAPRGSTEYYESVVRKMGGLEKTEDFYRLFMVSGMSHCANGPGPNSFGGILQYPLPNDDSRDDIVDALMQWVEHNDAPKRIVATKFNNDNPSKGILMTRPLCPFPTKASWTGNGSTNDASNFVCK
jgi:Tannase and feruloyl esterase